MAIDAEEMVRRVSSKEKNVLGESTENFDSNKVTIFAKRTKPRKKNVGKVSKEFALERKDKICSWWVEIGKWWVEIDEWHLLS